MYKALLEYGYFNFSLEIPEDCDILDTLKREQYYLDLLEPSYKICSKAGSSLGHTTSPDTRLKLKHAWLLKQYKKDKGGNKTFFEF